jgi:hypothetical protein
LRKNLRGLTLIELLLATSLFVVLGTILYSILSQGIVFLKRSESEIESSREERIILGKIATDVRVAFIHQWVKFLGEADQIYFCGLRRVKDDSFGLPRLSKVHYYFLEKDEGAQKKGLYLTEYPIEQSFLDSPPPGRRITDIFENFHFEYGYWDPIDKKIITKEKWADPEKIPRVVVLKGKTDKEFVKAVILSTGELMESQEKEEEEAEASFQMTLPEQEPSQEPTLE